MKVDRKEFWGKLSQLVRDDLASEDRPEYRTRREKMLGHLLQQRFRGKDVLEVGCGPGGNLAAIEKLNPKTLAGCDVATEMLSLARQRTQARLVKSEDDRLPFNDGAFDIVFSVTVLQHITDDALAKSLCAEMARVTRRSVIIYEDMHDTCPLGDGGFPWVARSREWYADAFDYAGLDKVNETRIDALVDHIDQPDSGLFCLEFGRERRRKAR